MAEHKIHDTFNKRFFDIPKYQRGFAWEKTHVRDLYDDIIESIETKSEHYLGTLVLSRKPHEEDHYYIVDGQQRIATITLFINEVIKHLGRDDRAFYRRFYITEGGDLYKLNILGKDSKYLRDLLKGKINTPESKSQRLLKEAYEEIRTIVAGLSDKKTFMHHIERLGVMEFIEENEGDAIRILGPSTYLYPLIVKLAMLGKLDQKLPGKEYAKYTFLDLIELIDVRVYKTKGTDPRADISRFAYELNDKMADEKIRDWLLEYNRYWMPKGTFEAFLRGWIYDNRALVHVFIGYCEKLRGRQFSLKELKELEAESPTIEHILAQAPKFTYRAVGFKGSEEFGDFEHRLGNLTVVERAINSAAQSKMPIEKVSYYDKSNYQMTKSLASFISANKKFVKQDIKDRTDELADYILDKWWC